MHHISYLQARLYARTTDSLPVVTISSNVSMSISEARRMLGRSKWTPQSLKRQAQSMLDIMYIVLLGTHDTNSPLSHLQVQHNLLEFILRRSTWPEAQRETNAFMNVCSEYADIKELMCETARTESIGVIADSTRIALV